MSANGSSGINAHRNERPAPMPPGLPGEAPAPRRRQATIVDTYLSDSCCCGFGFIVKNCLSSLYHFFADLWTRIFGREEVAADPLAEDDAVWEIERPVYTVQLTDRQYARMKQRFDPLLVLGEFQDRIILDDLQRSVTFNYDQITLKALAEKYQPFRELLALQDVVLIPPTERRDALIAEAREFFGRRRAFPARPDLSGIDTRSHRELLRALLKGADGVCLLEWHGDSSPKYVPAINMDLLKECNVRRIFIEDLAHETLQPEIDAFVGGKLGDKMPKVLDAYLAHLEKTQTGPKGYSERDIILAAKRVGGIRIIASDSEAAKQAMEVGHKARLLAFNYQTYQIERNTRGEGGKSLFLFGAAHGPDTLGVPGISTLFGYPTLLIKDAASSFVKGMHKNFYTNHEGFAVSADFALIMDAAKK